MAGNGAGECESGDEGERYRKLKLEQLRRWAGLMLNAESFLDRDVGRWTPDCRQGGKRRKKASAFTILQRDFFGFTTTLLRRCLDGWSRSEGDRLRWRLCAGLLSSFLLDEAATLAWTLGSLEGLWHAQQVPPGGTGKYAASSSNLNVRYSFPE